MRPGIRLPPLRPALPLSRPADRATARILKYATLRNWPRTQDEDLPESVTIRVVSEGVRACALDPGTAQALWQKSEEMVGETFA